MIVAPVVVEVDRFEAIAGTVDLTP